MKLLAVLLAISLISRIAGITPGLASRPLAALAVGFLVFTAIALVVAFRYPSLTGVTPQMRDRVLAKVRSLLHRPA